MISRSKKYFGIGDHAVARRRRKHSFLDDVDMLIDWQPIEKFLDEKLKRKANVVGSPTYPALAMFKILLLQRWYNLSDPVMEQTLSDHLSFLRFVDFSVEQEVPDETTICRFHNGLITLGIFEQLMDKLNAQFEQKGLLVREGAVVDASVVESSHRPRKVIEVMSEDRKEEDSDNEEHTHQHSVNISYSNDIDAKWLRKGNRAYYGYKIHVAVASKSGFMLGGHSTLANKSDPKKSVLGNLKKL